MLTLQFTGSQRPFNWMAVVALQVKLKPGHSLSLLTMTEKKVCSLTIDFKKRINKSTSLSLRGAKLLIWLICFFWFGFRDWRKKCTSIQISTHRSIHNSMKSIIFTMVFFFYASSKTVRTSYFLWLLINSSSKLKFFLLSFFFSPCFFHLVFKKCDVMDTCACNSKISLAHSLPLKYA